MEYIAVNSKDNTLVGEVEEAIKDSSFTQTLKAHLEVGAEVTNVQEGRIMLRNDFFGVSTVIDFAAQTVTDTFD